MKQIKTEPIYNGYTPDTMGRFIVVRKGRKYVYAHIDSVLHGHYPVTLKYAVSDTDRLLADVEANDGKYIDFAISIHYINDSDYASAIIECGIIRPLAVIKKAAIR